MPIMIERHIFIDLDRSALKDLIVLIGADHDCPLSPPWSEVQVGLSAKGLANIPGNIYENDFTFIVGEDRYQCSSFIASFLSPRIGQLQVSDSTLQQFVIATKDPEHYFHNFMCLGEGCKMTLTNENSGFFRSICCEL
jgi:hypothetical protein